MLSRLLWCSACQQHRKAFGHAAAAAAAAAAASRPAAPTAALLTPAAPALPHHHPPPPALQAFDELLLLKPGGASIYFGPMVDSSERLIAYFQSIPGVHPCPERYNPANWWAALGGRQLEGGKAGGLGGGACIAVPNLGSPRAGGLRAAQLWLYALPQPAFRRIAGLRMPCRPALPAATARRMLEVSNPGHEEALGIDFAEVYARSELAK